MLGEAVAAHDALTETREQAVAAVPMGPDLTGPISAAVGIVIVAQGNPARMRTRRGAGTTEMVILRR